MASKSLLIVEFCPFLIIFPVLVLSFRSEISSVTINTIRSSQEIGTNLTLVCVIRYATKADKPLMFWYRNKKRITKTKEEDALLSRGIQTVEFSMAVHVGCSIGDVYTCEACEASGFVGKCGTNRLGAKKPTVKQYPPVINGYTDTNVTFSCTAVVGFPERTLNMRMSKRKEPDIAMTSLQRHQQPDNVYGCVKISTLNGSIEIDKTNANYSVLCEVGGTNILTNVPIIRQLEKVKKRRRKGLSAATLNLVISVCVSTAILIVVVVGVVVLRRRCIQSREDDLRDERYGDGEIYYEEVEPPRYEEIHAEDMDIRIRDSRRDRSRGRSRRSRSHDIDAPTISIDITSRSQSQRSRGKSRRKDKSRRKSESNAPRRKRSILKT